MFADTLLHLLRWDLRRLRWWMAGIAALLVLSAFAAIAGMWGEAGLLPPIATLFLIGVAAVSVLQADSPNAPDAFYRGKPLPLAAQLTAKALAITAAGIVVPFAVLTLTLLLLGAPADRFAAQLRGAFTTSVPWVLRAMMIGALTRDLRTAFGVLVAGFVGFLLMSAANGPAVTRAVDWIPPGGFDVLSVLVIVWAHARRIPRGPAVVLGTAMLSLMLWRDTHGGRLASRRAMIERPPLQLVVDSSTVQDDGLVRVAYHLVGGDVGVGHEKPAGGGEVMLVMGDSLRRTRFVELRQPNEPTHARLAWQPGKSNGDSVPQVNGEATGTGDVVASVALVASNVSVEFPAAGDATPRDSATVQGTPPPEAGNILGGAGMDRPITANFSREGVLVVAPVRRVREQPTAVRITRLYLRRAKKADSTELKLVPGTQWRQPGIRVTVKDSAGGGMSSSLFLRWQGVGESFDEWSTMNLFSLQDPMRMLEVSAVVPGDTLPRPVVLDRSFGTDRPLVLPGATQSLQFARVRLPGLSRVPLGTRLRLVRWASDGLDLAQTDAR